MAHGLSSVLPAVDDKTISRFIQPLARGYSCRGKHEFSRQVPVGFPQLRKPGDMASGDYQDVGRGLGVDVPEGEELFIAMHFGAWYFACNDVAE